MEKQHEYSGENVFCELEEEFWPNFDHEPYNHACVDTCLHFATKNAYKEKPFKQVILRTNFESLVHYKYPIKFSLSYKFIKFSFSAVHAAAAQSLKVLVLA